jgi:hypothetical protein
MLPVLLNKSGLVVISLTSIWKVQFPAPAREPALLKVCVPLPQQANGWINFLRQLNYMGVVWSLVREKKEHIHTNLSD